MTALTTLESEQIVFHTKSFSMFGGGTPPPGNLPPVINGAYYYLKPGTLHIPYQLRADVLEPDGDPMNVYLVVGPAGGPTNFFSMTREGTTNWYNSNIPYEAMKPGGILIQVVTVDVHGQKTARPSTGTFLYPTDSGNPTYISQYNPNRDGDGYNDVWELDNGFNPNNAGQCNSYRSSYICRRTSGRKEPVLSCSGGQSQGLHRTQCTIAQVLE